MTRRGETETDATLGGGLGAGVRGTWCTSSFGLDRNAGQDTDCLMWAVRSYPDGIAWKRSPGVGEHTEYVFFVSLFARERRDEGQDGGICTRSRGFLAGRGGTRERGGYMRVRDMEHVLRVGDRASKR